MYRPSAPEPPANQPIARKDQIVLNLSDVHSAVQVATIDYYKRRAQKDLVRSKAPAKTGMRLGDKYDLPEPRLEEATQEHSVIDEISDSNSAPPVLTFDYQTDTAMGFGKLRVRGFSQADERENLGPNAASIHEIKDKNIEQETSVRLAPAPSSHFQAHNVMLERACAQLDDYKALRKSLTRRAAF